MDRMTSGPNGRTNGGALKRTRAAGLVACPLLGRITSGTNGATRATMVGKIASGTDGSGTTSKTNRRTSC